MVRAPRGGYRGGKCGRYNLGVALVERCADPVQSAGGAPRTRLVQTEAIIAYEMALAFNPRCAQAYNNLGVIYKDKGQLDRAVQCYQNAVRGLFRPHALTRAAVMCS